MSQFKIHVWSLEELVALTGYTCRMSDVIAVLATVLSFALLAVMTHNLRFLPILGILVLAVLAGFFISKAFAGRKK